MKPVFVAVSALGLTFGVASAADLPSRKAPIAPPPPPPPMWTGFYAGLNAGYNFGTNSNTQSVSTDDLAYDSNYGWNPVLLNRPMMIPTGVGLALSGVGGGAQSGVIGGGQIGYNYQYGTNVVIGVEADIQGAGVRGSSSLAGLGGGSGVDTDGVNTYQSAYNASGVTRVSGGVDWMGTVRGRVGYLWTPTMLVYATGGLTYGGVYANVSDFAIVSNAWTFNGGLNGAYGTKTFFGGGGKSQTLVGWNVGGGVEWMFMPNWSLKADGIYWYMGNQSVPTSSIAAAINPPDAPFWSGAPSATFGATRVNYQGVIARLGVNYHFHLGGI